MKCRMTDYVESNLDWEQAEYEKAGIDFTAFQLRGADTDEVAAALADSDVLIVNEVQVSRPVLEAMERCRLVIRHGDGYDNIDTTAATELGIVCANEPGVWTEEVADQALGFLYGLLLKLPIQRSVAREVRDGSERPWDLDRVYPVRRVGENVVGVIGFGKIGKAVARRLKALGFELLVHDPYVGPEAVSTITGREPSSLQEVLAGSDAVTLHVPATPETVGMIDAAALRQMKESAVLVNTSRGAVVVTDDLVQALRDRRIAAAALDVTSPEPLPSDHPLLAMENVVVTPHLAWYSDDALWAMRKSIVEDVLAFQAGRLPDSVVNAEVLQSQALRFKA